MKRKTLEENGSLKKQEVGEKGGGEPRRVVKLKESDKNIVRGIIEVSEEYAGRERRVVDRKKLNNVIRTTLKENRSFKEAGRWLKEGETSSKN